MRVIFTYTGFISYACNVIVAIFIENSVIDWIVIFSRNNTRAGRGNTSTARSLKKYSSARQPSRWGAPDCRTSQSLSLNIENALSNGVLRVDIMSQEVLVWTFPPFDGRCPSGSVSLSQDLRGRFPVHGTSLSSCSPFLWWSCSRWPVVAEPPPIRRVLEPHQPQIPVRWRVGRWKWLVPQLC